MSNPDLRSNLQVKQPGVEGYESADKNGWPTPLTDPSSPLKFEVTDGKLGSQRDFKAMSTSQQDRDEHSLVEGDGGVDGIKKDGLSIDVKVTEQNSAEHKTVKGDY